MRKINLKKGFTLVEAIFSLGVVGVLIICLYSAFTSGFSGIQFEREDARATQILVAKMDQLRLLNWEQLLASDLPDKFLEGFNPETPAGDLKKNDPLVYEGKIKIKKAPDDVSYQDDMREIEITLEWESKNGMKRERKLTTYVARYGLQNYVF